MEELTGNKFPLIGDQLPEMEVQTTHGKMKLPDSYSSLYNRVCSFCQET
jgi:peroxiredoxin (alkyl hydroperoxide reductase subunit C)